MRFHLVLTATVHPKGMQVQITDSQLRLGQYLDALRFLLTTPNPNISSITWIENSGADLTAVHDLVKNSNPNQLPVELISLDLNDFPRELGLGYGEFLAFDTGIGRATLIQPGGHLIKLTGRLVVKNLADILKTLPEQFDLAADIKPHNPHYKGWVDSRLMAFSVDFYNTHLKGIYHRIKGASGIVAEHILYDVVRQNPGRRFLPRLPREPRWSGVSGSTGMRYDSAWMRIKYGPKSLLRNATRFRNWSRLKRVWATEPPSGKADIPGNHDSFSGPLRIVYAAGPGDVFNTYRHWKDGHDDPSQVSITYSSQFYELAKQAGDSALVIYSAAKSELPARTKWMSGQFTFERRPTKAATGIMWHFQQFTTAIRLAASAIRYRADVLVIVCGTCHWFPLMILPLLGIEVVPSLHCVLWPNSRPISRAWKIVWRLNSTFFNRGVATTLFASDDIAKQLTTATRGTYKSMRLFLPSYQESSFAGIGEHSLTERPFRVLYAGRMESDKGVFDLITIAKRFAAMGRTDIQFDLCGAGSALEEVKSQAAKMGLAERFRCHGHLGRAAMRQFFADSHIVIVPTKSNFVEGFNQVVVEGVLSNRPVITSRICPAISYVRNAIVEVPPDDVQAYGDAILALADNGELHEAKRAGCQGAQAQFYDRNKSWGTALEGVLHSIRDIRSGSKEDELGISTISEGP